MIDIELKRVCFRSSSSILFGKQCKKIKQQSNTYEQYEKKVTDAFLKLNPQLTPKVLRYALARYW